MKQSSKKSNEKHSWKKYNFLAFVIRFLTQGLHILTKYYRDLRMILSFQPAKYYVKWDCRRW